MTDNTPDEPTQPAATGTGDAAGLAKLAGQSLFRAVGAVAKSSLDTATELAQDISSGEPITGIVDQRVEQVRAATLGALGIGDRTGTSKRTSPAALRAQGDAMIKRSWNVNTQPRDSHPAFKQILDALTPDEGRILRYLAVGGPQPAIDIRTATLFGVGSERLASGVSMVAEIAGCAWPDRDQHYLANLNRLGLVRFSEEKVDDFRRYSILTAHSRAMEALEKAKKVKYVYRSIYLSQFGMQFTEACYTLEGYDAGGWAHAKPKDRIFGKGRRVYVPKKHL